MATVPPDIDELKQKMRTTWMAGDFGKVAEHSAREAGEFVARLNIPAGAKVLDVACGTGNLSIPAALGGAQVVGADIALNLLEQARERAAAAGVVARFEEGDAEHLSYADGEFDVVMSMFGAIFAPRPELVAAELLRVCRPGGTIAMANWTREGFVGQTFGLTGRYAPPPPGIASPLLWGDEAVVKQRLGSGTSDIRLTRREAVLEYPFPPEGVVAFFREYFGPTSATFARLDASGQAALAADLEKIWRERNQLDGDRTRVSAEYLEVVALRA
jgi:SAM-dependent methyltransferase